MDANEIKPIITACITNGVVALSKFVGFLLSGSSSMLAESIHSLADVGNQILLWIGVKSSKRKPDKAHPFGYGQDTYYWNTISATIIFFLGCFFTVSRSINEMVSHETHHIDISIVAFSILAVSILMEGTSFTVAMQEFMCQAKKDSGGSIIKHLKNTKSPSTLAILLEDSTDILGLLLALIGMGLSTYTGMQIFDSIAAMLIGILMGGIAIYLAKINRAFLLNKSEPETIELIKQAWQKRPYIKQIERMESIIISPSESILMSRVCLDDKYQVSDDYYTRQSVTAEMKDIANYVSPMFDKHIFIEIC